MLAFTALKEVDDMRSSIENLRSRANGLEALLLQAFSKLKEQRDARPVQNYSPTYQPHIPNGFASSSTASPAATPSYPSFPLPPQPFTFPPVSVDLQKSPDIFVESRVPAQPVLNNAEADESSGVEGEPGQGQQDLREEEVAASLSLEFMALGRNRTLVGPGSVPHFSESDSSVRLEWGAGGRSALLLTLTLHQTSYPGPRDAPARPSSIAYDASSLPPNPTSLFPSTASLADVIPPYAETNAILRHALDWTGWYHGCIHAPTFEAELAEFWSLGDERVERANPAWLALFFAQLSSGVKHMTRDQLQALGTYGLSNGLLATRFSSVLRSRR